MQVKVYDNDVGKALRILKKKLQREGVLREMKERRHYMKPSQVKAREKAMGIKRARQSESKRVARMNGE